MNPTLRTLAFAAGFTALATSPAAFAASPRRTPTPTPTPRPTNTPTPTPTPTPKGEKQLWGFADLHAHPASHLSFGASADGKNGLVYGSPGDETLTVNTINKLVSCDADKHTSSGDMVEDGTQVMAFTSLDSSTGANHGIGGYPGFRGWPAARSVTHQQMHLEWLHRAYQGGLRLMVASVTDNKLLSALWANSGFLLNEQDINQINDYDSATRQLDFIVKMASLNSTWMEIAKNSSQAQNIISKGKLALVLGVELDDLTGDQLVELHKKYGVAVVNPIHLADNGHFGGSGVYSNLFNTLNRTMWGEHYEARFDPTIGFRLSAPLKMGADFLLPLVYADYVSPADSPDSLCGSDNKYDFCHQGDVFTLDGHANAKGLNDEGKAALKELWKNAMIVDLAHMSDLSQQDTLAAAKRASTAGAVPVIDSHTDLRAEIGKARAISITERKLLPANAQAIASVGGMIGLGTEGDTGARAISREQNTPMVRMIPNVTFSYDLDNPHLILALGTGDDNLDDESKVRATVWLNGVENVIGFLREPHHDDYEKEKYEELEELKNNSVQWVTLKLPAGTMPTDVNDLKLELVQSDPNCSEFCKNWKLRKLEVYYVGRTMAKRLYSAVADDYLHYFKGTYETDTNSPDWTAHLTPDSREVVVVETVTGGDAVDDDKGWLNFHFGNFVLGPWDIWGGRISPSRGTFSGQYVERPFALPEGKTVSDIQDVIVGTLQGSCETFCDNWDMNSIRISQPNPAGTRVILERASNPAFRFTGTDPTVTLKARLETEPPILPNAFSTDGGQPPLVEFLQISIQTGGDDLRFGNELKGQLIIDNVFMPEFSLNDGAKWFDGTSHVIIVQLPQPVPVAAIRTLRVRYTSNYDDHWKITSIQIDALGSPIHTWYKQYQDTLAIMGNKNVAIGTDLNGLNPMLPFSEVKVTYPLNPPAPAGYVPLPIYQTTGNRPFDFQKDGIAQVGQLPELMQAAQNVGGSPSTMEPMFHSADDFVKMWKKVEAVAATIP
jgi:microsomal dipeptidase-like Zn-dependent dipeptidase